MGTAKPPGTRRLPVPDRSRICYDGRRTTLQLPFFEFDESTTSPLVLDLPGPDRRCGSGSAGTRRARQEVPDLDQIRALGPARQFDRAQELMTRFLRAFPEHPLANLIMAQFALDRPDPRPEQALDYLRRVRPRTPREAAIVRFCEGKANRLRQAV